MPVSYTRHGFMNTTYSTSYGSATSSISRVGSGIKSSLAGGGYTPTSYRSRDLPPGPGPLDAAGRKLSNYSSVTPLDSRRNRTPNGYVHNGPLKADPSLSTSRPSRYEPVTKDYGSSTRPLLSKRSVVDTLLPSTTLASTAVRSRPPSGTSRPQKSSSLIDLSSLTLNSDVNTSSNRNRGTSVFNDRAPGSSSRQGLSYQVTEDASQRPDGTSRLRYTPTVSREASPTDVGHRHLRVSSGDHGESPTKSSLSNQSSSSSMSNWSTSYSSSSNPSSSLVHQASSAKYKNGGKVGLRNLGNTCFMNSVLQCLSNTRLLVEWCLEEEYLMDINTTTSNMKGSLIKAYANLMQSMWKDKNETSISPTAFKTQIQKFAPRFMGYAQQDSQEFLRYLLEGLHEDVNKVTKKQAPIILDDLQLDKKHDSGKAQEYWKAYLNRDNSKIVDIFVGQLKSELKFTCNHQSVTFDPFWDLSVSIPKNRQEVSLSDCLKLFMKEEELDDEERPMCTKCKSRRSCTKSFSIQRFPKILVLHLKRFSQERFGRKLTTLVDFPIRSLDLTDFAAEGATIGRRVLYDLYAVSNHSGGTSSGHYTAYCRNPYSGEWYLYNDARVTSVRSNEIVTPEAYVLFYELCHVSH
ncbi:ubiquitin carboxyl-terminal hydrolase 2-like isoform X2 [Biomphalaria glabrata]|uniref:Ubiquitin carboxyl-terminal hydrolase n=1 Tax=Biomphalaria glabrata TaxID=6526 RepID=A0A9W2YW71_BIOGL|nr:ubiquitin carboxyl-terminal hydrolase 2-like isoform X2 [Biomphalaria glabrata]XP_055866880.1 ubiquitin carboxyl-terminal hydrolase 2-like isoform X2 [Biomphalaria glabrata]XP_055866881.1 ubiquitin carboxyl-terminal hydrolase 2-like isoform X2 [Biomphalaria glabrata]